MDPAARRRTTLGLGAAVLALSGLTGAAGTAAPAAASAPAKGRGAVTGVPAPGLAGQDAQLVAVSCPAPGHCWAVGSATPPGATQPVGVVEVTTDGGARWHRQGPGAAGARGTTTTTTAGKKAAGDARAAATSAATSTTTTSVPAPPLPVLTAVSCADTRHCMAVGYLSAVFGGPAVVVSTDGGRSWRQAATPAGASALTALHCTTGTSCLAVAATGQGAFSASTADGGATWQRGGALPAGFGGVTGLACPGRSRCLVAGDIAAAFGHGTGAVARTADGGVTWTLASLPPGTGVLHAVSCAGAACLAVGTTSTVTSGVAPGTGVLLASTDGGATFTARAPPAPLDDGFAVACPAPSLCVAVGIHDTRAIPPVATAATVATGDLGRRVRAVPQHFVAAPLLALACPGVAGCVAAGAGELARLTPPARAVLVPSARRAARSGDGGRGGGHAGTTAAGGRRGGR